MADPYIADYIQETASIACQLDMDAIHRLAQALHTLREDGGCLYIIGNGGGASIASHAACDLRKLCGIDATCLSDNVAELTAWINDDGLAASYRNMLVARHCDKFDMLLVLSVGGGSVQANISANLVEAAAYAKHVGAPVAVVAGRDGGDVANMADIAIVVPVVDDRRVTQHTEGWQSVVLHCILQHPLLAQTTPKWESVDGQ